MDKDLIPSLEKYLNEHRSEIISDLRRLVSVKSPTTVKRECVKCADFICDMVRERLGIELLRQKHRNYGDTIYHVSKKETKKRLLLLCHYDTVEDPNYPAEERMSGDFRYIGGAGILEAKFGIVSLIWACKALTSLGEYDDLGINFIFNGDEEVGSPASHQIIEDLAKKSTHALVISPTEEGKIITGSKGLNVYEISVRGISAASGDIHDIGRSAIFEAAHIISYMEKLNDPEIGTTVNVNLVSGGTRYNVIPEYANLTVDVRYVDEIEGKRLNSIINGILPHKNNISINIKSRVSRPPVPKSSGAEEMLKTLSQISSKIGVELQEADISCIPGDNCHTFAAGLPTLCGLGAIGDYPRSNSEYIDTEQSLGQTVLLAAFLHNLSN